MAGDPTGGGGSAAGKGPRSSMRQQQFRDRAKTRVDDLQEIFFGLQSARKERRSADAASRPPPCVKPSPGSPACRWSSWCGGWSRTSSRRSPTPGASWSTAPTSHCAPRPGAGTTTSATGSSTPSPTT
ncbi:hypothetical protein ZWY2020_000740 [Hordeum vulgare]|nr:hypothetical protein ZWY2020_000740 [Hordeum vulgare]